MTILTLFVGSTKPIKYSHRGVATIAGVEVELVVKIDSELRRLLDVRWTTVGLPSPEVKSEIDRILWALVGGVIPETGELPIGGAPVVVPWELFSCL